MLIEVEGLLLGYRPDPSLHTRRWSICSQAGHRTCVIDFDIGLRNMDLHLGCERRVIFDFVNVIQVGLICYSNIRRRDILRPHVSPAIDISRISKVADARSNVNNRRRQELNDLEAGGCRCRAFELKFICVGSKGLSSSECHFHGSSLPRATSLKHLQDQCTLNQALIQDRRNPALSLLAASQTKDKDALTQEGVTKVIRELQKSFKYIVCDSPAGIESGEFVALG